MDFYYMSDSPPCRAVLLTAKALGLKLNKIHYDLMKGEHMNSSFLAVNPRHCVPTLVDSGFAIWESRAICTYLSSKYGNAAFYSKDPKKKAQIDSQLYFDATSLYASFTNFVFPPLLDGVAANPQNLLKVHDALSKFEDLFKENKFCVGDEITVADHCLISSVSSIQETGISLLKYPKILKWIKRCSSEMPGYEENDKGAKEFGELVKPAIISGLK